jgi:5-hydroxyisourate hydrolase
MSVITTHVLDAVIGKPCAGVEVRLEKQQGGAWMMVSVSATDVDGRCRDLAQDALEGVYRLAFDTGAYLKLKGRSTIYPAISIAFVCDGEQHYHLPLLLSDNSYTTYRGS